jgi:hypothetical protein
MSSGTIPNVATIVSYCGSRCFDDLKVCCCRIVHHGNDDAGILSCGRELFLLQAIVANGNAANGTASAYGCDLILPLRLLTQLLCLNVSRLHFPLECAMTLPVEL